MYIPTYLYAYHLNNSENHGLNAPIRTAPDEHIPIDISAYMVDIIIIIHLPAETSIFFKVLIFLSNALFNGFG